MGQWTQCQYDQALVTKVMQLFEHAVSSIEADGRSSLQDKRFRTFIKRLDPQNKVTQQTFKALVMHGGLVPRSRDRPPQSASMTLGPFGLPMPIHETMPIVYDGALPPSHIRSRQPGHSRSPTPIPPRPASGGPTRSGTYRAPFLDEDPISFEWLGPSSRPILTSSPPPAINFNPLGAQRRVHTASAPGVSHSRAENRAYVEMPSRSTFYDSAQATSPPNPASRAWLDEYGGSRPPEMQNYPYRSTRSTGGYVFAEGAGRLTRPIPQRIRRSRPPLAEYDSDPTEVPDDFDNLLNQPSTPAIRIGRRRRREAEEPDISERPAHRLRLDPLASPDVDGEWEEFHPWLNGLPVPMERSGRQPGRDRRRDGIVFDDDFMSRVIYDDHPEISVPAAEIDLDFGTGHAPQSEGGAERPVEEAAIEPPETTRALTPVGEDNINLAQN